ncbi:hypothetical protein BLD25_03715 [Candidatus Gracilibacteria bacterium GN02-872]|nr:hypothetical protein BLD25_03715 [Candidatus Gracilibacteria bacterium GN02-872]
MFYNRKSDNLYFLSSDKTFGEYGPFFAIYCKNTLFGENTFGLNLSEFPAYKYALGFTKKRVFILEENGNLEIKLLK